MEHFSGQNNAIIVPRPKHFASITASRGTPSGLFAQTGIAQISPNSEVAGGGGADEAMPECARPRAQQLASFKPRNIFTNRPPTPLGCGRDGRTPPTQKFNFGVRSQR
jgi:hypothetical protein